ncbi:MAG: hypothetical protein ACYCSJ_06195 [Acidimicrobiales bacterium]
MTDLHPDLRDLLVEAPEATVEDPLAVSLSPRADAGEAEAHRMAADELAGLLVESPTGPAWYADLRSDPSGTVVDREEGTEASGGFFAGLEGVTHAEPQWRRGDDDVIGSGKPSRTERRQVLRLRRRAD